MAESGRDFDPPTGEAVESGAVGTVEFHGVVGGVAIVVDIDDAVRVLMMPTDEAEFAARNLMAAIRQSRRPLMSMAELIGSLDE